MAHIITITDGTNTVTLTSGTTYQVHEYDPKVPELDDQAAGQVSETLEISVFGATGAIVQTNVTAIERLLEAARRRNAIGAGPRVYLTLQIDGEAAASRSEIIDARIEPGELMLRLWPNKMCQANLYIVRRAYWEGALTQLPLTNGNGTNNTSGLTIYNQDASGVLDNYVQIAAADVTGAIPAPVKFELTNSTGSAQTYQEIFAATNAFCDPANFTPIIEAESVYTSGGSSAADAACSGGNYHTITGTDGMTAYYNLAATLLQKAAGHDFHVLMRMRNAFAAYVRPSIITSESTPSAGITLRRGDELQYTLTSQALLDLGVMPLPPGGYSTAWAAQRLRLVWRGSGSMTAQVDYFAFFPAVAFRRLQVLTGLANGGSITDDPLEDRAYCTVSAVESPWVVRKNQPVMVWPNTLQRILFLWSLADHSAPIGQTFTVKAWYRPRKYGF